jgi:hypothetical protein
VSPMTEVTRILTAIEVGNPRAAEQLLPLVYQELRKLASGGGVAPVGPSQGAGSGAGGRAGGQATEDC